MILYYTQLIYKKKDYHDDFMVIFFNVRNEFTININKSQSIRLDWGKRKDRRTWKTGFITELLFTSLAVVMTDVSPMRTKETDLLTA